MMECLGIGTLVLLASLMIGLRWYMVSKARAGEGKPLPVLDGEFGAAIRVQKRSLLYFFSPHCGPCRAMTPVIDRLVAEHNNVFKFDVAGNIDIARRLQVMATPTVMLVTPRVVEKVIIGPLSEARLRALLE